MSVESFNIVNWNLLWQTYREQSHHCREVLRCREAGFSNQHRHSQPDEQTISRGFERRVAAIAEVFLKPGKRTVFCVQEVDRNMLRQLCKRLGKQWTAAGKENKGYFTSAILWRKDVFSYEGYEDVRAPGDARVARFVLLRLGDLLIRVQSAHLSGHSIADRKKGLSVDCSQGDKQLACYLAKMSERMEGIAVSIIGMDGNFAPDNKARMEQICASGWTSTDNSPTHVTQDVGIVCLDYQLVKAGEGWKLSWESRGGELASWSVLDTCRNYGLRQPSDHLPKLVSYTLRPQ